LRLNGFIATDAEVIAIIRRLDADGDNRVMLDEFAEGLRPAIPSPLPAPATNSSTFEESKGRPSSPLRRTATSPLRAEGAGVTLAASSSNLGAGFGATNGSPARTFTASASGFNPAATSSPTRRYSPMRVSDESELVRAFKEQIALENELEDAKNRLALQPDFNLPDAFDLLDRYNLGSLSANDLSDSLAANGAYAV
jgi:hypothetical protein